MVYPSIEDASSHKMYLWQKGLGLGPFSNPFFTQLMESQPNQRGSTRGFTIKNGSIKELSMIFSIENVQV